MPKGQFTVVQEFDARAKFGPLWALLCVVLCLTVVFCGGGHGLVAIAQDTYECYSIKVCAIKA